MSENTTRRLNGWLAVVLLVLGLATVGQGAYFSWQRDQTARCQAAVNAQLLDSLNASAAAGKEYRDQTTQIWRYILSASANRDLVRRKFVAYLDAQDEQERQRAAKPLPTPADLKRC